MRLQNFSHDIKNTKEFLAHLETLVAATNNIIFTFSCPFFALGVVLRNITYSLHTRSLLLNYQVNSILAMVRRGSTKMQARIISDACFCLKAYKRGGTFVWSASTNGWGFFEWHLILHFACCWISLWYSFLYDASQLYLSTAFSQYTKTPQELIHIFPQHNDYASYTQCDKWATS